jgi:uncharacterized protein
MENNSTSPQGSNQTVWSDSSQQPVSNTAAETNKDAKMWATIVHLAALAGYVIPAAGWVVGPLVVWLIKKDEFPFVNEHGKEALNFQISMFIYAAISFILCFIVIGFILLPVILVTDLICMILAAIKANNGQYFRYPLTIRLIK